jgi:putative hydrolase of the HAD superfamily
LSQVVLFDLGNTLVQYYELRDFPPILKAAIASASEVVAEKNGMAKDEDGLWKRVEAENFEAKDYSVRPLEARLQRIFQISEGEWSEELAMAACRSFTQPIFALAKVYDDVFATLAELRRLGYRTAVVSNTPWGSPASLWREEIARLGLADKVDQAIFCGDCGWRKPARQIFEHTLNLMNAKPEDCVFVGDDPRWDIIGPEAAGIKAVLIDRFGRDPSALQSLTDLVERL